MTATTAPESFAASARAFRAFFEEIAAAFLERERLVEQMQLALLSREHLLTFGPPGTAKSQLALSVMKRIVDAKSGAPSVFSKQIAETTVQSDLVGPVDFKVLTRTGRTEHLTDEGILGAVHGILDEVFDGREMLLRSILNLLEEREHKSGHKITAGRTECTVMTSNRYLSEVVQRNPELMLAFSDRISFVCFVPKGFARPASRAEMLRRAAVHERPVFRCPLTIQDLDVLQGAADDVALPHEVLEALERLADGLERRLTDEANRAASYRPTKYFSNRTLVKSIKALKAAVALDATRRKRDWPLVATLGDLGSLAAFFTLAGPNGDDLAVHLRTASDLRERAQLETVQLELKVFGEALAQALSGLMGGAEREASSLGVARVAAEAGKAVERLRSCAPDALPAAAREAAEAAAKAGNLLKPPPRFHSNALPLREALDQVLEALTGRLAALEVPEASLPDFLGHALKVVNACGAGGQHAERAARLVEQGMAAAALAFCGIASEQQAARFQPGSYESVPGVEAAARTLAARFAALEQAVADLATAPDAQARGFREAAQANHEARLTCAVSLLQVLNVATSKLLSERGGGGQPSLDLAALSAELARAEDALRALDPNAPRAREVVAGAAWKKELLAELSGAASVAVLHDRIRAVVDRLQLPWPVAGKALSAEAPAAVAQICRAVAKAASETKPPEALAKQQPRFVKAFPERQGELAAARALRAQLGLEGADLDAAWAPALAEAALADLASLKGAMAVLDAWQARLQEKIAENPDPAWRLNVVYESRLPQLLYLDRALPRARALAASLEQAGVPGAEAARREAEVSLQKAVGFCEGLVRFPGG